MFKQGHSRRWFKKEDVHLCGEEKGLTYEHVPARSSFNDASEIISGIAPELHGRALPSLSRFERQLRPGDVGQDVRSLQLHLIVLGYASPTVERGTFDKPTETALRRYQKRYALADTGTLDEHTAALMQLPRCGVPDMIPSELRRFAPRALGTGAFSSSAIYAYCENASTSPDIDTPEEVLPALKIGFSLWDGGTPIRISPVTDPTNFPARTQTIRIRWGTPQCGGAACTDWTHDGVPSEIGMLFWSAAEWKTNNPQPGDYDFIAFAAHEVGHALGLYFVLDDGTVSPHSPNEASLMYPYIPAGRRRLHPDDIAAAKLVYGE